MENQMLTYENVATAKCDFISRGCSKDYQIVVPKTVDMKRVIDFDSPVKYDFKPTTFGPL